ncbi:hypothetical protein WH52_09650 [Tenacibaculum holothuriorum]|uniref:NADPH--hemoprotein reductase n=1 Tax=Tenacibaculum holothuriorum TaxID=1635173 RepID=A0A1Y2PDH3_9FLAO|nr:hypothetical protein WH52_09650 [Tenacibaculum holothuriorum]
MAISSFIFICLAAITGIILAFEPISNQLKPYAIRNTNQITIAETLGSLKKEYKEVVTVKVDQNNFVTASVIKKDGKSETFYVNPTTGKKIHSIQTKASIYKFATNLHRSLFLKSTGRFLVGFFSFLLFLITVTGSILIIKRQGGIIQFFTKVVNEDFKQFYHVILGRYFLIPIVLITLTGVYLSLEKFSLLPKTKVKHQYDFVSKTDKKLAIKNFPVFKQTKLSDLKSIEFPFSEDEEDYFFVKLHNKELLVHQYSGEIASNQQLSWVKILSEWSLFLHTGRGSIFWSIVLLLSCFAILFFIYSGFAITLDRKKKSKLPKNKFKKDIAEFIILVGSESGSTFGFAKSLFEALLQENKTVYVDHLNNYTIYKNAKQLIILTATYGEGEAPTNASKFLQLLDLVQQNNNIKYSVVGLGSYAYPHFCQFAIDIDNKLQELNNFSPILSLAKINNQNFGDFKNWAIQWSEQTQIPLELKQQEFKPKKQYNFKVLDKTELNNDDSFLIRLQPTKKMKFQSGDLLSITPKKDNIERLYSIGKIENDILLSIKKHDVGICSNLLYNLTTEENLSARIQQNKSFHFPKKSKEVILIANGTGIAPFLGMLENKTKTHVFLGLRTQHSLEMYKPYLNKINYKVAFSQEGEKKYVQDCIQEEQKLVASVLKNGDAIMICGSVAMMNGVLNNLEKIVASELKTPLQKFKNNGQIKTDCY